MKEFGCKNYQNRVGVLIAQLGTPDAPTPKAVRPYLRQFLSDPRVIEVNRILWQFILNLVVLPTRPKRSARLYSRIWTKEGSPLLVITKKQTEKLGALINQGRRDPIEVVFGMRYGTPSIESAIDALIAKGCSRILLFPMYPHYAGATTGSTYDAAFKHLLKKRWVPTLKVAQPYYTHPKYIQALSKIIDEEYQKLSWRPDKLILSYHGIPYKYVQKGDPYCCMCVETTEAFLKVTSLPKEEVVHTYQSRFGRDPWLQPYTDKTVEAEASAGVTKIAVAAPGFTADCLETLDELGNEARESFMHNGGKEFHIIPCLNDHEAWISGMKEIVEEELGNWMQDSNGCEGGCRTCPMASIKI